MDIIKKPLSNLLSRTPEEIGEILVEAGFKAFVGKQIFHWLHRKQGSQIFSFNKMNNISKECRQWFQSNYKDRLPKIEKSQTSSDQSSKHLINLNNEGKTEFVIVPYKSGYTLCLSTQMGCPGRCLFCYSGQIPFKRNLTAGEILAQVALAIEKTGSAPENIVFMGMGDPLFNLKNVFRSIEIMAHPQGLGLGYRRFTISTIGTAEGIRKISALNVPINLTLSLHSANQSKRQLLIPLSSKESLDKLYPALYEYNQNSGRRITFAVTLMRGINDDRESAGEIASYIKGLTAHVNLIKLNSGQKSLKFNGKNITSTTDRRINEFKSWLLKAKVPVSIRASKGEDIDAACGLLATKG